MSSAGVQGINEPTIVELDDGRWMLNCRNQTGKTWPYQRVIHPGGSAYSCLTILPDGRVGLLYEDPYSHIVFTQFSLDWLMSDTAP